MTNSFPFLELEVIRWAEARKIIPNSTPEAQARKALEETGELISACRALNYEDSRAEVADAIGDVMVCLINCAALADLDITQCLSIAYQEIKDRKGTLLPNGVFMKEVK